MQRLDTTWAGRFRVDLHWLCYALPCLIVWGLYLLAYFPGLMSPDSISQWKQLLEFRFDDVHPAFHTLTNWLITRMWLSPASVAIVQIIALALVFGLAMRELEHWNAPRWIRIVITIFFSLSPVNGFMSITLWKDIPFTIALFALWVLFLRIASTQASALASPRFLITFVLLLIAASLFRHNGLPVIILVLLLVFWLYKDRRRIIVLAGVAWAIGFLLVKIVLYGMLQVAPAPPEFVYMLPIHQTVALRQSTTLLPGEAQFLDSMAQPEIWSFYRCYIPNPAIYLGSGTDVGQVTHEFFSSHVNDFLRMWLALIIRNPWALVEHQLCLGSMVWRVMPLPGSYLYTVPLGIDRNDFGLGTQSLLPPMQFLLSQVYAWSMLPTVSWWFWRPALHLCLVMLTLLFAPLERRQVLLLLSIPLFQSLVLLLLTAGQDTRYQYPIYVIMLIAPALLFTRKSTALSHP